MLLSVPMNQNTWHIPLMIDNDRNQQINRYSRTNRVSKVYLLRLKQQFLPGAPRSTCSFVCQSVNNHNLIWARLQTYECCYRAVPQVLHGFVIFMTIMALMYYRFKGKCFLVSPLNQNNQHISLVMTETTKTIDILNQQGVKSRLFGVQNSNFYDDNGFDMLPFQGKMLLSVPLESEYLAHITCDG